MTERTCPICALTQTTPADEASSCPQCGWDFPVFLGTGEEVRAVLRQRVEEARTAWQRRRYNPDLVPHLVRDPFDTAEEFAEGVKSHPWYAGQAELIKAKYDIKTGRFPIRFAEAREWASEWIAEIESPMILLPRDEARALWEQSPVWPIYAWLEANGERGDLLSLVLVTPDRELPVRVNLDSDSLVIVNDALLSDTNSLSGAFINDRYRVERNLNLGGGESEVYLCQDELPIDHQDRQVVLKVYKMNMTPKAEVVYALRNLDNAHLIRILDFGTWNGRFFEVLEYCRGGSMADAMPYAPETLLSALDQMVSGLDFCHSLGIRHGDIKPTNFLYRDSARSNLVLIDFGISSLLRNWKETSPDQTRPIIYGTLNYTAPELFSEVELISPKNDYYALGITLIHLLTGRLPFEGLRPDAVICAHLHNRIPLPSGIDERFEQLLRGLTQWRPENRWGHSQFQQWHSGTLIMDEQGHTWRHKPYSPIW